MKEEFTPQIKNLIFQNKGYLILLFVIIVPIITSDHIKSLFMIILPAIFLAILLRNLFIFSKFNSVKLGRKKLIIEKGYYKREKTIINYKDIKEVFDFHVIKFGELDMVCIVYKEKGKEKKGIILRSFFTNKEFDDIQKRMYDVIPKEKIKFRDKWYY